MKLKRLKQINLDQTGIVILGSEDSALKYIPLFSLSPFEEASEISKDLNMEIAHIFITNNLLEEGPEVEIKKFIMKNNYLPEDYMEKILTGFSYIIREVENYNEIPTHIYYK